MQTESTKEKVLRVVQELPQDGSIEDAMEKLYFLHKVEKGLRQANLGQKISHDEAKQRMGKWLE